MKFDKKIYDFDWRKLTRWMLPVRLRGPRMVALLESLNSGLTAVYARFLNYKIEVEYKLTITPQVCYLQKLLNDRFDFTLRRITITDGAFYPPILIFRKIENKHQVAYIKSETKRLIFYRKNETEAFKADFQINIPSFLSFDESEMRAIVNEYKLAGKLFTINKNG